MGVKETAKQVATAGAGVALAAAGCQCGITGAVDPPPPPLVCTDVGQGGTLRASGSVQGTTLLVTISHSHLGTWRSAEIVDLRGVSLSSLAGLDGYELHVEFQLASEATRSGSFTVRGTLADEFHGTACDVRRTFTFTIGARVEIAALDAHSMPLASRHAAQIAMVSRDGLDVELEAKSSFGGPYRCTWNVSGGELLAQHGNRARWRLPEQRGFYQAQLLVDFGPPGVAFDSLSLEVV
jgi:hypothetical protein